MILYMNEGKNILISAIEKKLNSFNIDNLNDLTISNINLVELIKLIEANIINFSLITDEIFSMIKDVNSLINIAPLVKLRDKLLGEKDYNINVELTDEEKKEIVKTIGYIKKCVTEICPSALVYEIPTNNCHSILNHINNLEIINEFSFIEECVKEYNTLDFDNCMIKVLLFINTHNASILTDKSGISLQLTINTDNIKNISVKNITNDILSKLDIKLPDLPNNLVMALKNKNEEEINEVYSLIKKNKVENYGILHLIQKNNKLLQILFLLYASTNQIKTIVDLFNNNNACDIASLKILINYIPSVFFKQNEEIVSHFDNFINNYNRCQELGINNKALISKCPLFYTKDYNVIESVLSSITESNTIKKNIISRCYKTLTISPELIKNNYNYLKNKIDIKAMLDGKNYNLLKVADLENKIDYIKNKGYNLSDLTIEEINKLIIGKIYYDSINSMNGSNA